MAKTKKDAEKPEEDGPTGPSRRWLKIGWELEGAWADIGATQDKAPCIVHGDGSVTASTTGIAPYSGEIVCAQPYERLGPCLSAMKKLWPDVVNESCGFHVHVSFNTGDYQVLTDPRFYEYFKEQWTLWGNEILGPEGSSGCKEPEFWNRFRGRNRYCEARHDPESQMLLRSKGGERYKQLNYCWSLRRTIECRMLPMFKDREIAALAVKHLLWIYTSYLNSVPETEERVVVEADKEKQKPLVLQLADDLCFGESQSDVEELEVDPEVDLANLSPKTAIVLNYKDSKRTDKALARKLSKQYPSIAKLIKQMEE